MYSVLLVEDDAALRFIYKKTKTWSECGFTITAEASNGKDALELLEKEQFDLIFTDIRMPFVDGIEMLRRIREAEIQTPVIFASSYDEFEYARQGLILGAFDYLLKPVEQNKLRDVLLRTKTHIEENAEQDRIVQGIENVLAQISVSPDRSKFVGQVAAYCSAHYGDLFSVDDIAAHFGYSKDYFCKIFKQNFNLTFQKFYARIKIAYAVDLLHTGNYKTYEISDILGYASVDYFTKVFKEITGVTPSAFRQP